MTITWGDAYKIGDAEIDAQHEELFGLINKFLAATDRQELTMGAMTLFKYTREHFTHEESLMRRIGYPAISAHVEQHNELISRLNAVAQTIANETFKKSELEAFLRDWLLHHVGTSDAKLAKFIELVY